MIPITSTSAVTTPPPIVNTTTPGTNETHLPSTMVAPSFSSAQLDNNASGNNTIVKASMPDVPQTQTLAAATSSNVGVPQSASDKFTLGAQTNFIAQLIAQGDNSPSAQGVLVQYEKLVNIANVKYKPSDAAKPQEQPSNLFGKLVQQSEHDQPVAVTSAPKTFSAAQIAASSGSETQAPPVNTTRLTTDIGSAPRSSRPSFAEEIAETTTQVAVQNTPAPKATSRGISAYLNTASRVQAQSLEDTSSEDPISQVA